MRRGELLGLQWPDVDLGRARVAVHRSLVTVGHEVIVSEPRRAKGRRSVALDPATVAALKTWRKHQTAERLAWGPAWTDSGFVFTREDGRPLHPREVTRAFSRHVLAAGLPVVRLHDLRHTRDPRAGRRCPPQGPSGAARARQHRHHPGYLLARRPALEEEAARTVAKLVFGK